MHIQKKSKQLKDKLQKNYNKIAHKKYSAVEAIYQILDIKTSVKKINVGLISIGKNDDLEKIDWSNKQHKVKFLKICEELINHFDEQRDLSMRGTEKNLSEMNDQLNKMRKSLSQKGLISKINGNIFQFQDKTDQKASFTKTNLNHHDKQQNRLLSEPNQGKETQNNNNDQNVLQEQQNLKEEQNYQEPFQQQNQNQQQKQQQNNGSKVQQQDQSKQIKINLKHIESEDQKQEKIMIQKQKKEQLIQNQWDWQQKTKQIIKKQQKMQEKLQNSQEKDKILVIKDEILDEKQMINKKKLDTLPQQMDNQFYQDKVKKQKLVIQQKKHRYNPHLEIIKKQVKKKRQQPQARNQLQSLYFSLERKLIQLFAYYIKQLKTNSFTFDGHPQCLDLKTFSTYYKYFKLGEIYKITQIPKYFKKYSTNGTWMNQKSFIHIHTKILDLGQDAIKTIDENIKQKEQFTEICQKQLNQLAKSNLPQKQKQIKQKQINDKKVESQKKYTQLQQKLKKINSLISEQQIRKLIRKGQKKPKSPQASVEAITFDRQRLKKIVQAHSGIYKQDIIFRLQQKKLQKQKKNELKVNRILEKYKFQNKSNVNLSSNFHKKINQSAPQLRRIQGYAQRNKFLRHGLTSAQNIQVSPQIPSKLRLNSQPKNKPYLQLKQVSPLKRQTQAVSNHEKDKKTQVYKQLSLPKLPKRKMKQQSIYQSLKLIDTKAQLQFIKNLLSEKSPNSRQDQIIFNQYNRKQKQIIEKQKTKKSPIQNRMKFS